MAAPNLKALEDRVNRLSSPKPGGQCMFQMSNKAIYTMTHGEFFEAAQLAIAGIENHRTNIILKCVRSSGIGRLVILLKAVVGE